MKLLHAELAQFQNCTAVNKRLSLWYTVHTYAGKNKCKQMCIYIYIYMYTHVSYSEN